MAVNAFLKEDSNLNHINSSGGVVSEAVGGVSPVGWVNKPEITLIDLALNDYEVAWAAAGHPHSVYPTSFEELARVTGATPMVVGD